MGFNVIVKEDECIGCGACIAVCEDNFELKDGKAIVKNEIVEDIGCNQDASESCPMNCISVEEV